MAKRAGNREIRKPKQVKEKPLQASSVSLQVGVKRK
jgi:hypothetical protein